MIQLTLTRLNRDGKAVRGTLTFPLLDREDIFTVQTLENADHLIPDGTYKVERTWSPKFRKFLPELLEVPEYSDQKVTGVPDGCQQSASGGESKGRSCPTDLAERYRSSQSPCRMRSGIRIHRGTLPEHSKGCILLDMVGMTNLDILFNQLSVFEIDEEVFITVTTNL